MVKDEANSKVEDGVVLGVVDASLVVEDKNKEKGKRTSIFEGSFYGVMEGFGLRFISPFALAFGAKNFHIGLLNSLPTLFGNLLQFSMLKKFDKYSRKKIVFFSVLLQAFMWFGLLGASVFSFYAKTSVIAPYAIIFVYTLLIGFGAVSGPAWVSWMKDLVTKDRGVYFAKRNRIIGFIILVCSFVASFVLDFFKGYSLFLGFVVLFSVAFFGRLMSGIMFLKQYEPKFVSSSDAYFSFWAFVRKMPFNNFGRFVLFYALLLFSVSISGPFFAVYMLENLKFSYFEFTIITLSSTMSSLVFMPVWGRFSDKFGNIRTMKLTGVFIPFIPLLWFLTAVFGFESKFWLIVYLFFIECYSGFIWAGFNLAVGNFIFDTVSVPRVAICSAYMNFVASVGTFLGAAIGGVLASFSFVYGFLNEILFVFLISTILRIVVYFWFRNKISEVREVKTFDMKVLKEEFRGLRFREFLRKIF